jgi:hypothetical protein
MKLWEIVAEHRLRRVINVTKNQFSFMPGRSIDYRGDFLALPTYGEIYGAEEGPTYGFHRLGEGI